MPGPMQAGCASHPALSPAACYLPCPQGAASRPEEQDTAADFKIQFKLSCSAGVDDTVALEARALLVTAAAGNYTVTVRGAS